MGNSILDGKRILLVDDEPDIVTTLEEEIGESCSQCRIDKAASYAEAARLLESEVFDLVVLDIMGVRGFDLLGIAVKRKARVAMLTAHALSPEALKKSYDMGARAYLPKDQLGEIVPFLEDVLLHEFKTGWQRLLQNLGGFFDERFEKDWRTKVQFAWVYDPPENLESAGLAR